MKREHIGKMLTDAFSEDDVAAGWPAAKAATARIDRRRRYVAIGSAVAVVIACAIGVAIAWPRQVRPHAITRVDGRPLQMLRAEHVRFDEGSHIDATHAELEVIESSPSELAFHLVRGSARFEVTPGTGRRWQVETAGIRVSVVGTIFTTERDERTVRVAVERGIVVVRGAQVPDGVRRLTAGQSLTVVIAPEPEARVETIAPALEPQVEPAVVPSASVLMRNADRARREGRGEDAIRSLRRVVEIYPSSEEAPLAAFTIARLYGDREQDAEARIWYRRALALGLHEPLRSSAQAALEEE